MGAVATAAPAGCAKVATAAAALAPTPVTLDIQAGTQAVIAIVDASVVWACKCGTEDVSTKQVSGIITLHKQNANVGTNTSHRPHAVASCATVLSAAGWDVQPP